MTSRARSVAARPNGPLIAAAHAIEQPQLRFRAVVLVVVDGFASAAPPARTWNGESRRTISNPYPLIDAGPVPS